MRILLVNDDGFHAPGFEVLRKIAAELTDDVWAVAPATDQSGLSHSITLSHPLRFTKHGERDFSVTGTPTDCVIMGVKEFMPSPPDLILSGVNHGQNAANDVTYSGTAAGAMEGAILGIRSFALSLRVDWGGERIAYWDTPKEHAPSIIQRGLDAGFDPSTFINVNFPDRAPSDVMGEKVVPQGAIDHELFGEHRRDGRGQSYYWLTFQAGNITSKGDSDIAALREGYTTITPMRPDYTDRDALQSLGKVWGNS
ncbi:MAG: 5'/3'-nucleotidase SurE [Hyphomicrobiales bacterium]